MSFTAEALAVARPASLDRQLRLPRRQRYHPSPVDWQDEVLYFLLVDRFSDGDEDGRSLLNREDLAAARSAQWRWDAWAESGTERWQGGTLKGVTSKLDYLQQLGVTALWLSPVLKQRGHLNSFHGYGVQDFLDVDPRLGSRADLVDLSAEAHLRGMRVILDVIFNHSGANWVYPPSTPGGEFTPTYTSARYPFGAWLGEEGTPRGTIEGSEDGVWPYELQDPDVYTRAGSGSLGAGDLDDPNAEARRTDFITLRDFRLSAPNLLTDLALCYKYWIALTDCDGFRLDTLKHVSFEEARNFCGTIKEFAANLGKADFFLVGEIAGGDYAAERYLEALDRNLNAALDIGEMRLALRTVAKGLTDPRAYFDGFNPDVPGMGSHRNVGKRHVSILDDHDHVFGEKTRFSSDAPSEHQVVLGTALQLFTVGIPCIYYGSEQALSGPESAERRWLPGWMTSDRYLREAMFGPEQPRASGRAGLNDGLEGRDSELPGFGPFGTAGHHCFDPAHPAYARISVLTALRGSYPVLRHGRQYLRQTKFLNRPFSFQGAGEVFAWSRILDDEEALCVANGHGTEMRGADVVVDAALNLEASSFTVVANTAEVGATGEYGGTHAVGSQVPVRRTPDGTVFVEIRNLGPSEVLVLTNRPDHEEGALLP